MTYNGRDGEAVFQVISHQSYLLKSHSIQRKPLLALKVFFLIHKRMLQFQKIRLKNKRKFSEHRRSSSLVKDLTTRREHKMLKFDKILLKKAYNLRRTASQIKSASSLMLIEAIN